MSEPKWTPFVGQSVPEPERLRGSKEEIAVLLAEFDRLCTTLPVWAMRLINGLRHEWKGAEAELEGWKHGTEAAKNEYAALILRSNQKIEALHKLYEEQLQNTERCNESRRQLEAELRRCCEALDRQSEPNRREEDFFRPDGPDHIDESEECPHGVLYCEPCTACFPPRFDGDES